MSEVNQSSGHNNRLLTMLTQNSHGTRNNTVQSPTVRGGRISKIIWPILFISLSLNVVHWMDVQLSVSQNYSVLESVDSKEDCSSIPPMGPSSTGEPPLDDQTIEPIRFIAVGGPYHTGSTNIWYSIDANIANGVARSRNITLGVFPGGYPPCGVPLFDNFDVDMGRYSGYSSGIIGQNKVLNKEWGTMWNDWKPINPKMKRKPPYKHLGAIDSPANDVRNELPPHKSNKFYSWWKHTPPQHPMMNCFRSDTLYVIMVRHPVAWKKSTMKESYDFKYKKRARVWELDRKGSPRRLPNLSLQFKSLYHAWAYYMQGFLGWESVSSGRNCYESNATKGSENCLGGKNNIPSSRRNMILVRQEDYSYDPQGVLANIFAFATRGIIDAEKDKHLFFLFEDGSKGLNHTKEMDKKVKEGHFKAKDLKWEGAKQVTRICKRLGYSCDGSPSIFLE